MRINYHLYSLLAFGAFIFLFSLMVSGTSFGSFGKFALILMGILPILGIVTALKGDHQFLKIIGVGFNLIGFCLILFIFVMGIGEV